MDLNVQLSIDDQIDPVSNASQVEGVVNSKLQASGGISFDKSTMDTDVSAGSDKGLYTSQAVFPKPPVVVVVVPLGVGYCYQADARRADIGDGRTRPFK